MDNYQGRQTPVNPPEQSGFKLDTKTIVIGAIIILAAVFLLPRLLNTNNVAAPVSAPANQPDQGVDANITLGPIAASTGVDRDGCPTGKSTTFDATQPIYVVAQNSNIPAGTSVFVRLYANGTPVEDAPEITANQDYTNSCVNFVFEPADGPFDAGNYEAEFIINGNAADTVTFTVQ